MRRYITALILGMSVCAVQARFYNGPASGGFLTDSNNWSLGVFDNTQNPPAGTSTGDSYDLVAGDRSVILASDYATFNRFTLGTDNNGNSNPSGAELLITGGTLSATNMTLNPNTVLTARVCTVTQSAGDVKVFNDLYVGQKGEANYTISGGSLTVSNSLYLGSALAGYEHTFSVEGQAASTITIGNGLFAGAGAGDGYQNLRFKLGETGITPITVGGDFFADEQTEIIVDGADYTGGVQTITLATYSNNEDGVGVVETFINFTTLEPSLIFTNGALKLELTTAANPELLLDGSFETLSGNEPNTNSLPWFTSGEGSNGSFIPTTVSGEVRTGLQALKFNFYYDAGAVVQDVDKTLLSGETYEYSVWNLITEPSGNANHTNASTFNLSVFTSDNGVSNYVYRIGKFGNLATNENEYQQFVYNFTTAGLINNGASLGDYIQVRIAKANGNSTHKLCFDDASLKTVDSIDNSYASWSNGWGVAIGGEQEDYDNDGLLNLYEYGLGGNPTNGFVNGNIPTFGNTGSGFEYVYAQRTDDPTLSYYLETDLDLVNLPGWTNSGYTVVATNVTGGTFDYVTNAIPSVDNEKFIRLMIEN